VLFHASGGVFMKLPLSKSGAFLVVAIGVLASQTPLALAQAPASPAPISQEEADGIILDRQLVMQQLDKDTMALGEIVAGIRPADKMADHAKAIAKGAKEAFTGFEPNVPGGAAKPEIWSNWDDYSKRMQAFVTASEAMAKAAETGNIVAVSELMIPALPCKQCHDVYRTKK
jgi:cytochrome c556